MQSEEFKTRRLHPVSILFRSGAYVKSLIIPGLIVLLLSSGNRYELWIMIFFIPAVAYSLLNYFFLRYTMGPDEMIVKEGVIFKNVRNIPYSRIQNIDLKQNLLHRWFSVADVTVETAGGARPEAVLKVISMDAVEKMRRQVFTEKRAVIDEAAPESEMLLAMSAKDLALFGLISNKGVAVILAALGLTWEFDEDGKVFKTIKDLFFPFLSGMPTYMVVIISVVILVIVLKLLSIIWAFFKLYRFSLERYEEDLHTKCGLFTLHTAVIPRFRIQCIRIIETFVQRILNISSLKVVTAGGGELDEAPISRKLLAPVADNEKMKRLLFEIQPEISFEGISWTKVDPRAKKRIFKKGIVISLIITAITCIFLSWFGLLAMIPLLFISYIGATLEMKVLGYALTGGAVLVRHGWWVRKRTGAPYSKIQVVSLKENPFDRRYGMASITVDTAGAAGSMIRIKIPYLQMETAKQILNSLNNKTAASEFRW